MSKSAVQSMASEVPPILTLSDAAVAHIRTLIDKKGSGVIGIRVGIKTAGCSGMKYHVEYATEAKPLEESITAKGVTVFIDPKAVMFLLGSEMDWHEDVFASGFVFRNPNEVARCGCGESFSITPNAFDDKDGKEDCEDAIASASSGSQSRPHVVVAKTTG